VVPTPGASAGGLAAVARTAADGALEALQNVDFSGALNAVWQLVTAGNRYIDERAPWEQHKSGRTDDLQGTLYDMLDCLRVVSILIEPFMPCVARTIRGQLGLTGPLAEATWADSAPGGLAAGGRIARGQPIFPRDDLRRMGSRAASAPRPATTHEETPAAPLPTMPEVSIEEFARLDLRVGEIVAAKRVDGKDRLLEVQVSLGAEVRTVAAGIAQQFPPETLVGKRVVLVANLKPAKIGGVASHGMILAAGDKEPLAVVTLDRECPLGTKVR
jgi:methionyl-tRNA synthetase